MAGLPVRRDDAGTNSTATGNGNPSAIGGGFANRGGALTLRNVTSTGNLNGGVMTESGAQSTTAQNSIFGAGFGMACTPAHVYSSFTVIDAITNDLGNNLAQDTTCALLPTAPGNVIGEDPRLAPVNDNSGETPTAALLFGSPAINAGNSTQCSPLDQVGNPRFGICDMGAFEAIPLGQPTAVTEDATSVTGTEARMTATVNLAGEAGMLSFEWGTAPGDLANRTPGVGIGPDTPTTRNELVGGLPYDTTIYYRALAENASGGVTSTVVKSFRTLPGPPQVVTASSCCRSPTRR